MIEHEDENGDIIHLQEHPGKKLLDCLNRLRLRMESSGIERTAGLKNAMGDDCVYFRKSLDIFIKYDWDELEKLINEAHTLFNEFRCGTIK